MSQNHYQTLVAFLREQDWTFHESPTGQRITAAIGGRNGSWLCLGHVDEDDGFFSFYSLLPARVPSRRLPIASEVVARANYGLRIGSFELDHRDGEIRYKTGLFLPPAHSDALRAIRHTVAANLLTTDRYLPAIMGAVFGDLSAEQAVHRVEHPLPPALANRHTLPVPTDLDDLDEFLSLALPDPADENETDETDDTNDEDDDPPLTFN